MSILNSVVTGKTIGPQIHTIAGNNGVGKTTWATSFPKSIVLDLEKGSEHLNVARVPADLLKDLPSFRQALADLGNQSQYTTVAVDSAEALEALISDFVAKEASVKSVEDIPYGKGQVRCREIMREIMIEIQSLKAKGITTVIVAHTQVKTINDPATNQTYDRIIMRCNDKLAAIIRDLSDNVFYATYKVFTNTEGGKTKAYGDGQRVMYTEWRPGYDAKNRLELPPEIPLSYDDFQDAVDKKPAATIESLTEQIKKMSAGLKPDIQKLAAEQLEKYKNDLAKLKEIKNRLMKYVA